MLGCICVHCCMSLHTWLIPILSRVPSCVFICFEYDKTYRNEMLLRCMHQTFDRKHRQVNLQRVGGTVAQ